MARELLHVNKLKDFIKWCDEHQIESRPPNGSYQVAQVRWNNGWHAIYERSSTHAGNVLVHLTVPRPLEYLVKCFIYGNAPVLKEIPKRKDILCPSTNTDSNWISQMMNSGHIKDPVKEVEQSIEFGYKFGISQKQLVKRLDCEGTSGPKGKTDAIETEEPDDGEVPW